MNHRVPVQTATLQSALKRILDNLEKRIKQHGRMSFIGAHEVRGALDEEWAELLLAIHDNNKRQVQKEISDLAVGCLFGLASLMENEQARRLRK